MLPSHEIKWLVTKGDMIPREGISASLKMVLKSRAGEAIQFSIRFLASRQDPRPNIGSTALPGEIRCFFPYNLHRGLLNELCALLVSTDQHDTCDITVRGITPHITSGRMIIEYQIQINDGGEINYIVLCDDKEVGRGLALEQSLSI